MLLLAFILLLSDLNFSEAGNYGRVVVQELLTEIVQIQQVGVKRRFQGAYIYTSACLSFDVNFQRRSRY
jgi:hypothetical protein